MHRLILSAAAAMVCCNTMAQTVTFDRLDYKGVGVYDTWEKSPFRTGELEANVGVVENHLKDSVNSSSHILGVQRSCYGSNTFGARVMLNKPWRIGTEPQYVHVLLHKPVESRIMLIGLGNRGDRLGQSQDVEQFWVYPMNDIGTGEWVDAVFSVKANNGVDIYSFVLAPDVRSNCREDFVAYIDNIEINGDRTPRTGVGDYPINLPSQTMITRYDRRLRKVSLDGDTIDVHTVGDALVPLYIALLEETFQAVPCQTVKPGVDYNAKWMHSYVYLDKNNDGVFSADELMAYTPTVNNEDDPCALPSFVVPSDLTPGIYRMRYKVDWDNNDPGGDAQTIVSNGGSIVDVLLNVHALDVTVNNDNRNGEVLTADGRSLDNLRVPYGKDLKVKMVPSKGFGYAGIKVRHGYNLTGEARVHSNPQYREEVIDAAEFAPDHTVIIPGRMVDGNLLIEGLFVSSTK